MSKFLKWLVLSSENPKEVALTIEGIIVSFVPGLLFFLEGMGVSVLEKDIVAIITIVIGAIGLLLTIIGLIRKLINTFSAEEVVVFKAKKKK